MHDLRQTILEVLLLADLLLSGIHDEVVEISILSPLVLQQLQVDQLILAKLGTLLLQPQAVRSGKLEVRRWKIW